MWTSPRGKKKRKGGKHSKTAVGVPEPARISLLDVVNSNFEFAKKTIYVNRIIYIGEHSFNDEIEGIGISGAFEKIISEVNNGYFDEKLTGLFLSYKKFFVHMVEGSEDSIVKHLYLLYEEEINSFLGQMKMVIVINHINQRFFNDWITLTGKPTHLLEKIDPDSNKEKSSKFIFHCIQKVYQLCSAIRELKDKAMEEAEEGSVGGSGVDFVVTQQPPDNQSLTIYDQCSVFDDGGMESLLKPFYPEINLLNFLINCKYLKDPQLYLDTYGSTVVPDTYQDQVWPIPNTLIPYSIFDKVFDLVVDLPSQKVEEKEEDALMVEEELAEPTT